MKSSAWKRSSGPFGIAVVGCGTWGMNHVRVWHALGCLQLVCDTDRASVEAVRARYPDVPAVADVGAVLADPEVQGVVIATPAPTHPALALAALHAGKDVLVEKPMALRATEARLLVDTARRLGLVLQVGHLLEYHAALRKLRELADAGALGRLRYVYSNRLNLGRFRTEESVLWSFAPHDLAFMLGLVGTMPEEVACQGAAYLTSGVADVTLTSLRFPSGVHGHIFVSWLHPVKEHRMVVVGEGQMAVFDDTRPWADKLVLYPHGVGEEGSRLASRAEPVRVPVEGHEPLRAECEEFLHCGTTRRQPLTDGESGLRVVEVLEMAQGSLDQGGWPQGISLQGEPVWIHPTSVVDGGAEIGPGTKIWHYSHVMGGARIGKNCVLGQNVFVGRDAAIGDGVKIQNNVSVYEGVELEDDVFCGPSVVFTNVLRPRSPIEHKDQFLKTVVRGGATLGANCTIVCGVTIGRWAFVAAGAVVTKDVPDHAMVAGVPAGVVGWVCECGAPLSFVKEEPACTECSRRFRGSPEGGIERERQIASG
jgi:UDP-2-acetamido-3-amino-2,3-dideoxy-glucuronate N-acetyltransferase